MSRKWPGVLHVIVVLLVLLSACTPKPGLPELVNSAVHLEVWRENQLTGEKTLALDVTDKGILSRLSSLLKQAQSAPNVAELREYCALVFRDSKSAATRLPVYCDYGKYAIGFDESIFWLPETFMTSLDLLDSLPQASGEIAEQDGLLLVEHGQSALYRIAEYQATLPPAFSTDSGSMPIGAYWYASNVLSRDIGLDFSSLLGSSVEVVLYKLSDPLGIEEPLRGSWDKTRSRAVILHRGGSIVGAWLDAGPGIGCSLDGSTFEELDPNGYAALDELTEANGASLSLSPEELIRKYFAAIDAKDYAAAHSLEAVSFIMKRYMFEALRFDRLYQQQFAEIEGRTSPMSLSILRSSKVTTVTPMEQQKIDFYYGDTPLPPDARVYLVCITAEWDQSSLAGNMSAGNNEFVVATCPTERGERIVDISPR